MDGKAVFEHNSIKCADTEPANIQEYSESEHISEYSPFEQNKRKMSNPNRHYSTNLKVPHRPKRPALSVGRCCYRQKSSSPISGRTESSRFGRTNCDGGFLCYPHKTISEKSSVFQK